MFYSACDWSKTILSCNYSEWNVKLWVFLGVFGDIQFNLSSAGNVIDKSTLNADIS